jgi:Ca2+-binding EF-hand superfamily protein
MMIARGWGVEAGETFKIRTGGTMTRYPFTICLAILVSTLATAAEAQRTKLAPGAFIQQWDPDRDGTLDLNEIRKAAEARFDSLDRNKDGKLDRKEISRTLSVREFSAANPDKDATLEKNEYMALVEARFKAANPDNDGTLDAKELASRAGRALMRLLR